MSRTELPAGRSMTAGQQETSLPRKKRGARLMPLLLAGAAALALAGCETGPFAESAPSADAKPQRSTRIVDRDVEAPQVFQVTEDALWDGRPSLGGVWVASPEVTDPERVIMRNPANGKFVIGALFKRERDNPGPKLQISSDAAEALGMLAGQPAKLSVTALRREQAPEETPATPVLDSNESLAAAPGAAPGAIDAGGVATMALDAPAPAAKPGAAKPAAGTRSPTETAAAAGAAIAAAETAAKPAAPAAPAPAAAAPSGGKPIQIGFFSVEANATRARDQLAKAGVEAQVRKESSQGKDYWSVFARGDAALLKKIKAAGFADAYMLK